MISSSHPKRIYTKNEKVFPGCGYNYLSQISTENSVFSSVSKFRKSSRFLYSKNIAEMITRKVSSYDSGPSIFEESSKTFVTSDFINSLADLNSFLGENTNSLIGLLSENEDFYYEDSLRSIKNVIFDDFHYSLFVKAVNESGQWILSNEFSLLTHNEDNEYSFRQKYGDSFVEKIGFGNMSIFRIDIEKSTKTKFAPIKQILDKIFHDETMDKTDIELQLEQIGSYKTSLLYNSGVKPSSDSVIDIVHYIRKLPLISFKQPSVIYTEIKFYDESDLKPTTLAGYQNAILNFENNLMPKALDLYQCAQFFEHLIVNRKKNENKIKMALSETNEHLDKIKEFTEDLITTCWSQTIPQIPDAQDVLNKYRFLDNEDDSENFTVRTAQPKINTQNFGTHNIAKQTIRFSNPMSLCIDLFSIFSEYRSFTANSVPKYILFPSDSPDVAPSLDTNSLFGRGARVFCPKRPLDVKQMLCSGSNATRKSISLFKYVFLLEIVNSGNLKMSAPSIDCGNTKNNKMNKNCLATSTAVPRAISQLKESEFLLHKKISDGVDQIEEKVNSLVERLSALMSRTEKDSAQKQLVVECTTECERMKANLNLLKSSGAVETASNEVVSDRCEQLVYGPKVWCEMGAQNEAFREGMSNELKVFVERNLSGEDKEVRELRLFVENKISLEREIGEKEKKAESEVKAAFDALLSLNERMNNPEITVGELEDLKTVLLFLERVHNDIEEEASLKIEKVFELSFENGYVVEMEKRVI